MKKTENKPNNNSLYLSKDGIMKEIKSPDTGFGKTVIYWENNKPTRIETSFTEKIK